MTGGWPVVLANEITDGWKGPCSGHAYVVGRIHFEAHPSRVSFRVRRAMLREVSLSGSSAGG